MDLIGKFSSSVKEKMEKYLASSTFELELYNATSNSNANQASTKGMYLIAEKSYNYECLLTIIARIRQRLISDQRKKWKRINKTVHLIEFLLKNGSFQFVIVFIDKFLNLVKPYVNYTYTEEGTDRGYAVRECCKRILELAKDRQKLKQERADSGKLKKRIQGEGSNRPRKAGESREKRYVIDEDAFYNQKEGDGDDDDDRGKNGPSGLGNSPTKKYDVQMKEPNLARRLGLDEEAIEKTKAEQEKEKNRKKTKEELEKEKEIDEVRQIIEGDSKFNKYIKEVDLLGIDIENNSDKQPEPQTGKTGDFDLLGVELAPSKPVQQGQNQGFGIGTGGSNFGQGGGIPQVQFGQTAGTKANIVFNPNVKQNQDSDDFGDFVTATEDKNKLHGFNKTEMDLVNFDDLQKQGKH